MNTEKTTPRLLGAAFLFVAIVSLISGLLLMSVIGSGSISDVLMHVSHQLFLMRISSLGELVASSGIVALTGLLYSVLHKQHKLIALVALGCWLAEAVFLCPQPDRSFSTAPFKPGFRASGSSSTFLLSNAGCISV